MKATDMKTLPQFESERLTYRAPVESDREALTPMHGSRDVMRYISDGDYSEAAVDERVTRIIENDFPDGLGMWMVHTKDRGAFIGLGMIITLPDSDEIEIGYRLDPKFWRQGYGTEIARRFLRYGFEVLELEKIVAVTDQENIGSQSVLRKAGMPYVGLKPAYGAECSYFSLSRADYDATISAG